MTAYEATPPVTRTHLFPMVYSSALGCFVGCHAHVYCFTLFTVEGVKYLCVVGASHTRRGPRQVCKFQDISTLSIVKDIATKMYQDRSKTQRVINSHREASATFREVLGIT